MTEEQDNLIPIATTYDKDGRRIGRATMTPSEDTRRCKMIQRKVIPVMLVPGVMGSNLQRKDPITGVIEPLWLPPNEPVKGSILEDILHFLGEIMSWAFKNAQQRQQLLNPDYTSVYLNGPCPAVPSHDEKTGKSLAIKRGWGSVHRMSYAEFLVAAEKELNNKDCFDIEKDPWKSLIALAAGSLTGQDSGLLQATPKGMQPVTEKTIQHANDYYFPVWACGYNWLRSNQESATGYRKGEDKGRHALTDWIDAALKDAQKDDPDCDKVILLSHSMGGIVTRAFVHSETGPDKTLGVIHTVMPASGAPATFKRLRAGFGGETNWSEDSVKNNILAVLVSYIFGNDLAHTAPVLLNSSGPLELLPWPDYGNASAVAGLQQQTGVNDYNQQRYDKRNAMEQLGPDYPAQWVRLRDKNTKKEISIGLEDAIFGSKWFSALPALADDVFIGPAIDPKTGKETSKQRKGNKRVNPWNVDYRDGLGEPMPDEEFVKARLTEVQQFQKGHLTAYLPDRTYAFYSHNYNMAQRTWWSIVWEGALPAGLSLEIVRDQGELIQDGGNGRVVVRVPFASQPSGHCDITLCIRPAEDPGDVIVPSPSGIAPREHLAENAFFTHSGYSHLQPFNDDTANARQTLWYAIAQLAGRREDKD